MSHSNSITPRIDLVKGPALYIGACVARVEVHPGVNYETWYNAAMTAAHVPPRTERGQAAMPWPVQPPPRRDAPSFIRTSTRNLSIPPIADMGPANPVDVYMRYLTGFLPHEQHPEALREAARESLILQLATQNAVLAYAVNHGASEFAPYKEVDPHAVASALLTEAEAAIARYNAALRQSDRYR